MSCYTIIEHYDDARRLADRFEKEHQRVIEALRGNDFRLGTVLSESALQGLRNVGVKQYGIGVRSCDPYNKGAYRDVYLSDVIDYLIRHNIKTEEQAEYLFSNTRGIGVRLMAEFKEYIFPYLKLV